MSQRPLLDAVRHALASSIDAAELDAALNRVAASFPEVEPLAPVAPVPAGDTGRVVTVFSPKGGAGKSVVATNLAVLLAQRCDRVVVLLDADLQFGDAAVLLKFAPRHTIVDVVGSLDSLDADVLSDMLTRHGPSGLLVLPAPLEPAFADQVSFDQLSRILDLLRTFASHVVVDTPSYLNDAVLGLIDESDDVLLVSGLDIPNVKNVKIALQTLRLLNTPMAKIRLVLNRPDPKAKLDVGEVERSLQLRAAALVPADGAVPQSVNRGAPVVLDAPRSSASKALSGLADLFEVVPKPKRRDR
ncbi:cell division ATPase MinD [soil metagenome]